MVDSNDPASVTNMYNDIASSREMMLKFTGANMSEYFNQALISQLMYRYALNRITWIGLPEYVSPVVLEQLMLEGETPALYAPKFAPHTPLLHVAVGEGNMDNQRLHTHYTIRSLNGRHHKVGVPRREIALLDPRMLRLNINAIIVYYANLFDEFDKSLKSNLKIQKTPVILYGPEGQRITMKNKAKQYDDAEPAIFEFAMSGDMRAPKPEALNFNVHYVGDQLLEDRRAAWNDAMTWMGIDNINQDKKERMVADEVSGNSEQIEMSRLIELEPRRQFATQVGNLWPQYAGLEVVWNRDYKTNNYVMAVDNTVEDSADTDLMDEGEPTSE